jgi:hypothetical protein
MIWGIGTGKCGTSSLASYFGGLHEPSPGIRTGKRAKEVLLERINLGSPLISDMAQHQVIPEIIEVDPDYKFVWLVRNPWDYVASRMAEGRNKGKAGPGTPTFDAAIRFWLDVNTTINTNLSKTRSYKVYLVYTEQIPVKVGTSRYKYSLDSNQHKEVGERTRELYESIARWTRYYNTIGDLMDYLDYSPTRTE